MKYLHQYVIPTFKNLQRFLENQEKKLKNQQIDISLGRPKPKRNVFYLFYQIQTDLQFFTRFPTYIHIVARKSNFISVKQHWTWCFSIFFTLFSYYFSRISQIDINEKMTLAGNPLNLKPLSRNAANFTQLICLILITSNWYKQLANKWNTMIEKLASSKVECNR